MKSIIGAIRNQNIPTIHNAYNDGILALGVGSSSSELCLGCPRRESVRFGKGWRWLGKNQALAVQHARLAAFLLLLRCTCRREWLDPETRIAGTSWRSKRDRICQIEK